MKSRHTVVYSSDVGCIVCLNTLRAMPLIIAVLYTFFNKRWPDSRADTVFDKSFLEAEMCAANLMRNGSTCVRCRMIMGK